MSSRGTKVLLTVCRNIRTHKSLPYSKSIQSKSSCSKFQCHPVLNTRCCLLVEEVVGVYWILDMLKTKDAMSRLGFLKVQFVDHNFAPEIEDSRKVFFFFLYMGRCWYMSTRHPTWLIDKAVYLATDEIDLDYLLHLPVC